MDEREAGKLSDEQLLRLGRDALLLERYEDAAHALRRYCDRLSNREKAIPPSVIAYYGLALGHSENVQEGLKMCMGALSVDRRNPTIYLCLARLHVLAGSRKSAVDAVARGLRFRANHSGLNALRESLGVRQGRPIPFLPRASVVNIRLGRALRKLKRKIGPARALACC